jgi:hypothetical protein
LQGQPALITASGELQTIPPRDLSHDFTETHVQLQLQADGSVTGSSRLWMRGSYEPTARSTHASLQHRPMERVVNSWLSRFMEAGHGELKHPDPRDLRQPWQVDAVFELEPVINVPGPSALALPVGLAAGNIRDTVRLPVYISRQKLRSCASHRHVEVIELQLPDGLQMTSLPPDTSVTRGVFSYSARYQRTAQGLTVHRELIIRHPQRVCLPETDRQWHEVLQVIKRDLRAQVFIQ